MDELGRVIANLMNSLPENQSGAEASAPPSAPFAGDAQDGLSMPEGGEEGNPLSFLSGPGGGDLMGMLGAMGGGMPHDNHKMQLLIALKPYLRPERCERVDRLCRLLDTAYGVRGALRSLGGVFHV